jgi:hypothetical protein
MAVITSCLVLPPFDALAVCPGASLQDTATAKKLAFAREVNTRCITLEGDDFNPSGLLTGVMQGTAFVCLIDCTVLSP